ncbi:MAG: hypothetical protein JNM62_10905 [Flavobacteriales bacterium]|nr:hypothetical protein [Flavobacteriales bacterium]
MNRVPHLRLLERIKHPPTESALVSFLWRVGAIVIFPLVLILGLGIMALAVLTSALSKLFSKRKSSFDPSSVQDSGSTNPWQPVLEQESMTLYQRNIGEIRFGPGYFALKSVPDIKALNDQTFGDWRHPIESGILLQRWNSTTKPDADLLFLDTETRTLRAIAKNIPSVLWRVESTTAKETLLICDTGRETLKYSISI